MKSHRGNVCTVACNCRFHYANNQCYIRVKAECSQCDDCKPFSLMTGLFSHNTRINSSNRSNEIRRRCSISPKTQTSTRGVFHVELLHNPYINYRRLTNRVTSSGRSIRAEADAPSRRTHGPRRRIGVEETEEKSGKQTSAEPEAENTT